jgi:hypothetical protein
LSSGNAAVTEDAHHDAPTAAFETSFHADQIIAVNAKGMNNDEETPAFS